MAPWLSVFLSVLSIVICSNAIHAATPEVRATWLTTTGNDAIASPAKTEATMSRLREIGLNTVYVECWKNGYTEFPSPTLKKTIGIEMKVNGAGAPQRDLLAEAVLNAHRNGLLCFGWLEYGLMAAYRDTHNELRAKREWLTTTADGADVSTKNGFVWLNPFHPDVQQFLIDISLDAIREHDVDGIQLDDRIALPIDLGYDPYTRELYRKETGSYPPDDPHDAKWMAWRADKISEFAQRYVTELRAANPDLLLSVSPAPYPWSYDNYLCDWHAWTKWCYCGGRRWDEYVPQCYRMDGAATIQSVMEQVDQVGADEKQNLVAGIRVVGDGPNLSFGDLQKSIEFGRQQQIAGHALWFSKGVLEVYPDQLKAFYDVDHAGRAASPMRPTDWRPLPIVATRGNGNAWTATVTKAGRYQVIAHCEGAWSTVTTLRLEPGAHTFVQDADAVELLVDRRP